VVIVKAFYKQSSYICLYILYIIYGTSHPLVSFTFPVFHHRFINPSPCSSYGSVAKDAPKSIHSWSMPIIQDSGSGSLKTPKLKAGSKVWRYGSCCGIVVISGVLRICSTLVNMPSALWQVWACESRGGRVRKAVR
jgi:hypothetical protein